eukprot:scaffold89893_cov25-Prasinocladus_malaysianus.AAC.1
MEYKRRKGTHRFFSPKLMLGAVRRGPIFASAIIASMRSCSVAEAFTCRGRPGLQIAQLGSRS